MSKNAISYLRHGPSGCYWYRIKQPMEMLSANGVATEPIELNKDLDDSFVACQFYGAYPFSFEKIFQYMKETGKRIVYDTDDALDLIDLSNPFYYSVKRDTGSVDLALRYADQVTVSTPAMERYMRSKTNLPITVIPNCYTPSEWTFPRPQREGIRIGFAGSATHVQDLIDIIPIIEKLQKKYDITFLIMGFGMSDYQTWYKEFRYMAPPEATKMLLELDKRLMNIRFEWVPYIEFIKYPMSLINMALDIGICPLTDTPFNQCRSACKAMEYTLSGALAIASNLEPYKNDHNSVLVYPFEWEEVLEYYITHPNERKAEHASHLKWTQENRNIETQLEPLKKVYGV